MKDISLKNVLLSRNPIKHVVDTKRNLLGAPAYELNGSIVDSACSPVEFMYMNFYFFW